MSLVAVGFPALELQHAVQLPSGAPVRDVVDAVDAGSAGSARTGEACVLVTCDGPEEHAGAHVAGVARQLATPGTVSVSSVSLPATRAALLLRCLDYVAPYLSAADLHAVVPAVDAALRTVAVVDSVARLRRPAPGVAQHGLGLVPGSRFAVDLDAEVVGAPSTVFGAATATTLGAAVASAVAVVGGVDGWYARLDGAPADPTITLTDVEPRTFWGARRFVELSVLPEPLELVVERALQAPSNPCPTCEREVRSTACPFCGVVPTPQTPTVTPSSAPTSPLTTPLTETREVPAP